MKLHTLLITMLISLNCLAQSHELLNRSLSNHLSREINGYIEAEDDDNGVYITHIAPPSTMTPDVLILHINSILTNGMGITILSEWKRTGKTYTIKFIMESSTQITIKYFTANNKLQIISISKNKQ